MDLKKKLDFYRQQNIPQKQGKSLVSPSLQALAAELGGEICTPSAPYLKITRVHELTCCDSIPQTIRRNYINRLPQGGEVDLQRCLFFDLETTGLAGGAGTFAFLLGFAFFEEKRLKVVQYFLPDYGREYYLFRELQEILDSFATLVSFNGKSYDLPLLKSRFVLNRIEWQGRRLLHFDLLHAARRLWKDSFPACDLGTLEENLLRRRRNDDIPGAYIPQAYFTFLQTGVVHDIKRIIHHNYLDLVSLAELLIRVEEVQHNPELLDDAALQRFLNLAFLENDLELFERLTVILQQKGSDIPAKVKAWHSLLHKRRGTWPQAVALWQELITSSEFSFFALEELSKYQEHIRRAAHKALEFTEIALRKLEIISELNPYSVPVKLVESFKHRRKRLLQKIS